QRARCDPPDRVHRVHHFEDGQLVRLLCQRDAAADAALRAHDPLLHQVLQHLRQVRLRHLRRAGDVFRRPRRRRLARQVDHRTHRVFDRLRKHDPPSFLKSDLAIHYTARYPSSKSDNVVRNYPGGGPAMKTINESRLESDLGYRFEYLAEFMGFGAGDVRAIHAAAPLLAPRVPALVDAIYVKLFGYSATKRHFVPRQFGYEGKVPESLEGLGLDHEMIEFRKQHLARYLAALVTKPYDGKLVNYLDYVGKMHTPKAGS